MDDATRRKRFGQRLRGLREARGLNMRELAAATSISYNYVRSLEAGIKNPPSSDVLQRLARVLGVTVDDLLSTSEPDDTRRPRIERALDILNLEAERSATRHPERVRRFAHLVDELDDEEWEAFWDQVAEVFEGYRKGT